MNKIKLITMIAMMFGMSGMALASECDKGYWLYDDTCYKCGYGYYCPGDDEFYSCKNGYSTTTTAAQSSSSCERCPKGTDAIAEVYGCLSPGYYATKCTIDTGPVTVSCSSHTECGIGYYCNKNKRTQCPTNSTTITTTASSIDDCICNDGYEMRDNQCVEVPKQAACSAGVSELWAGTTSFPLYDECDSPALWINVSGGSCCVNLESGTSSGAINVSYGEGTFHTTK